mmetsp:Transcript_40681/g.113007  ORF Transcript_40681/g.113007 Transcript_40681/m.113007 type:complete len:206 (+) Transcript_40681:1673-2290(+)
MSSRVGLDSPPFAPAWPLSVLLPAGGGTLPGASDPLPLPSGSGGPLPGPFASLPLLLPLSPPGPGTSTAVPAARLASWVPPAARPPLLGPPTPGLAPAPSRPSAREGTRGIPGPLLLPFAPPNRPLPPGEPLPCRPLPGRPSPEAGTPASPGLAATAASAPPSGASDEVGASRASAPSTPAGSLVGNATSLISCAWTEPTLREAR